MQLKQTKQPELREHLVDKIMEVSREDGAELIDAWEDVISGITIMQICVLALKKKNLEEVVAQLYSHFDKISDDGIDKLMSLGFDAKALMESIVAESEKGEEDGQE